MKKIFSVILVLIMVLTMGISAFAADVVAGDKIALQIPVSSTDNGVKVSDVNGILTIGGPVVVGNVVYVEITAPANGTGKVAKVVVKDNKGNVIGETEVINVIAPAEPVKPAGPAVLSADDVKAVAGVADDVTITMNGYVGISAEAYNYLKNMNYETITFAGDNYTWTLTRGDYTKMNITAPIYFDVKVDTKLWTKDKDGNVVEDFIAENAVLKALGNTQADPFYVVVDDNCNIGNIAANPKLVIVVDSVWMTYNYNTVDGYKFDGEKVIKVTAGLGIKNTSRKLDLKITSGGVYVFVQTGTVVNTTTNTGSTQKPNASTGANSAAGAVVALAVMGAVALATKKISK